MQRIPRAAVGALLALSAIGCSGPAPQPSAASTQAPSVASPAPGGESVPLPPPEALTGVIYRLADPALPGAEKVPLVEDGTPSDAATLDRFAAAMRDGGFDPLRVDATDIRWSERPAGVIATIAVNKPEPEDGSGFSFPMEFQPGDGGWQLARETAEMLLAFPTPTPAPAPAP